MIYSSDQARAERATEIVNAILQAPFGQECCSSCRRPFERKSVEDALEFYCNERCDRPGITMADIRTAIHDVVLRYLALGHLA